MCDEAAAAAALAMRLDVALLVAAETAHRCFSHAANHRFHAV